MRADFIEANLDRISLPVAEMFVSPQGEGPLVGQPSIFIRLNVCNLRCAWGKTKCDAWYTSWEPRDSREVSKTLREILEFCNEQAPVGHVVITGGEPFVHGEKTVMFSQALASNGYHITFETNGTIYHNVEADLIVMSPKLESSVPVEFDDRSQKMHEKARLNYEAMSKFMENYDYVFKFVVDMEEDFDEIFEDFIGPLDIPNHMICIMPQGIDRDTLRERAKMVLPYCYRHGFRYTPRIQIDIFGNTPGT